MTAYARFRPAPSSVAFPFALERERLITRRSELLSAKVAEAFADALNCNELFAAVTVCDAREQGQAYLLLRLAHGVRPQMAFARLDRRQYLCVDDRGEIGRAVPIYTVSHKSCECHAYLTRQSKTECRHMAALREYLNRTA